MRSLAQFLAQFLVLLTVLHPARAQIMIDASLVDDYVGKTFDVTAFISVDTAPAAGLVDAVGEDQMWDISGLVFEEDEVATFAFSDALDGLPRRDAFPSANLVTVATSQTVDGLVLYDYQESTSTQLLSHGLVLIQENAVTGVEDTVVTVQAPPIVDLVWPLVYGATWRDSSTTVTDGIGSFTTVGEHEVDGWGTLITPAGSREVLRITSRLVESIPTAFSDTSYTVRFIAATGESAELLLDGEGNLEEVNYEVFQEIMGTSAEAVQPHRAALRLEPPYPNPSAGAATVRLHADRSSPVRVALYDVLGREAAVVYEGTPDGVLDLAIDAAGLPTGLYAVRAAGESGAAIRWMVLGR